MPVSEFWRWVQYLENLPNESGRVDSILVAIRWELYQLRRCWSSGLPDRTQEFFSPKFVPIPPPPDPDDTPDPTDAAARKAELDRVCALHLARMRALTGDVPGKKMKVQLPPGTRGVPPKGGRRTNHPGPRR